MSGRPSTASVFVSVCCPHFEDKRDLLLGLAREFVGRGIRTSLVLAGNAPCPHIIRLDGNTAECDLWFGHLSEKARACCETTIVGANPTLEAEVTSAWQEIAARDPRTWSGQRLDVIARASLVRRMSDPTLAESREALTDLYEKDTLRHLIYYRDVLQRCDPDVVVYFGGQFHQDRAAFVASRQANIPAYAIETSFIPGCIYLDPSGVTGARGAMASRGIRHEIESSNVSTEQRLVVDQMIMRSFNVRTIPEEQQHRNRIRRDIGLAPGQRLVLFLAQVEYDASVTNDGEAFANQEHTIAVLFEALSTHSNTALAVRPHPKSQASGDASSLARSRGYLLMSPQRVALLDALQAADVVATVNSQTGLQAAWLGIPVITLGVAPYAGMGFSVDAGGHPALVSACLTAALATPRGSWQPRAVAYIARLLDHVLDAPTPSALATRILAAERR